MRKLIYIVIILLEFYSCKAQENKKIIIPEVTKNFEKLKIKNIGKKHTKSEEDKYIEIEKQSYGFISRTYYINSCFKVNRKFYQNFNIMSKGLLFNNGSKSGVWYEFDKKGKLIKETNTDVGYDFGWDKILEYCNKNNIILEKGYPKQGGIKTEIYKNDDDGNKVWEISYYDYKKEQYLGVTLDGKTGKLLKEQVLEFEGN